jgi:hypothetical protein
MELICHFAEGFVSAHKKTFGILAFKFTIGKECARIYEERRHANNGQPTRSDEVNRSARRKFSAQEQIPLAKYIFKTLNFHPPESLLLYRAQSRLR